MLLLMPVFLHSQIKGKIKDKQTGVPIYGAILTTKSGEKRISDPDGIVEIPKEILPTWVYVTHSEYSSDSLWIKENALKFTVELFNKTQQIETMVVSANRRAEKIEEVPISMEILSAELIDNKAITNLEETVNQSPGVFAMDGQVSVRGGSGFAYGVGSRVMVLYNGIPLLSPDLGDSKWNAIPLESSQQIEVIKGASSVLYGSGALNGLISVTQRKPTAEGDLKVKFQSGIYDNPKRSSLIWWDKNPMSHLLDVYYGKSFQKSEFTVSANGYDTDGYKQGETESRGRIGASYYYKPNSNIKVGLNVFGQYDFSGRFILWESDSLAYTPFGETDPTTNSSLTYEKSLRFVADPSLMYIDKKKNKHNVTGRYFLVTIGGDDNVFEVSVAEQYYLDYQFNKRFGDKHQVISGLMTSYNKVRSPEVFGDHNSINSAGYAQYELKVNRWKATLGLRLEYFKQDTLAPDSRFDLIENDMNIPIYPVFRAASYYRITASTHARISFGQGIRFPSVGERFLRTSSGGVNIFPNPELKAEKGWSAELGVKQGVRIGNWKGFVDLAGFVNHYDNMIEFTVGIYNPDTIQLTTNPDAPGYINKWVGFRANNSEEALISGFEFSMNGTGRIKEVEITTLLGYTYLEPISLNSDSLYQLTFSDSGSNILKYRFKHLAKLDLQVAYKGAFIGFSGRYNSFMSNIDAIFEDGIAGVQIMPGLKEYRIENNTGSLVFDARIGYQWKKKYRVNFVVNNILNEEYSSRPGDIQAPRQFILQLQYGI